MQQTLVQSISPKRNKAIPFKNGEFSLVVNDRYSSTIEPSIGEVEKVYEIAQDIKRLKIDQEDLAARKEKSENEFYHMTSSYPGWQGVQDRVFRATTSQKTIIDEKTWNYRILNEKLGPLRFGQVAELEIVFRIPLLSGNDALLPLQTKEDRLDTINRFVTDFLTLRTLRPKEYSTQIIVDKDKVATFLRDHKLTLPNKTVHFAQTKPSVLTKDLTVHSDN